MGIFFYYAFPDKYSKEREYCFIYPLGDKHIEFSFFNQREDLILSIMRSIQFFKGDRENPNYPY